MRSKQQLSAKCTQSPFGSLYCKHSNRLFPMHCVSEDSLMRSTLFFFLDFSRPNAHLHVTFPFQPAASFMHASNDVETHESAFIFFLHVFFPREAIATGAFQLQGKKAGAEAPPRAPCLSSSRTASP